MENELHTCMVSKPPEKCRSYSSKAEHQTEKHTGNHTDLIRLQVCGIHQNCRKGRRNHKTYDHGKCNSPSEIQIGQSQCKRSGTENREQNHIFPAISVTKESPCERTCCQCGQKREKTYLRLLDTDSELVNQEKCEITRHA